MRENGRVPEEQCSHKKQGMSRTLPPILIVLVVLVVSLGGVTAASPAAAIDLPGCNNDDAPFPASPYGDGAFIKRPSSASTDLPQNYTPGEINDETDPFRNPDEVSLESSYGTTPTMWTFDNGCSGQFVPGAGTALANIGMQISGMMPNWSHAFLASVISDDSLFQALDEPVESSTEAIANGVWRPWLPVALLLVAVLVFWRARDGRFAGAVTAATTALGVLGITSVLIQYPTESVKLLDDGVRSATTLIATGLSENKVLPEADTSGRRAADALDLQMDDMVRATQYRTWLAGAFGDPDSDTAREFGPRVFRSTHFTWAEYAAYRSDPDGVGKKILEAKQEDFKQYAEEIKDADPVAYEYFTGSRWSSRLGSVAVNFVVIAFPCVFLLLAGLMVMLAFVLSRLVIPFAPAAGVIFLFDRTRDLAVGWIRRVGGPLVMGPVYLLAALLLLRLSSAIFAAEEIWFILKFGLIAVLTIVAWRLTNPAGHIPGLRQLSELMSRTMSTALGNVAGARAGQSHPERAWPHERDRVDSVSRRPSLDTSPGGVWYPTPEMRAAEQTALPPPEGFVPYTSLKGLEARSAVNELGGASPGVVKPDVPDLSPVQRGWPRPEGAARKLGPPLGPRTPFPGKDFPLEPNIAYEVEGRGTYFTDENATLHYVDTAYGDSAHPNPDLNHPAPDVTFTVSDRHVFVTDHDSRTIEAHDPHMARRDAPRSGHIQTQVGRLGGRGYDGGHLIANYAGGGRERVNIVAMLQELNRSGSPEYGSIPNSFYQLESGLRDAVDAGREVTFSLYVDYANDGPVPTTITVEYSIDGEPFEREFENVRPPRA